MGICLGKSNDASSDLQNYRSKLSDVSATNVNNNAPHDLVRLFLIGTGEVGKSTIIKQMQKLCVTNARDYEMFDDSWQPVREAIKNRSGWTLTVHQNALAAIGTLIQVSNYANYDGNKNYANLW
jgi:GTPase SAR1 family protein